MTINFYLNNDPKSAKAEKIIYLYIRDSGKTLTLHTGERLEPKDWDAKKQKVKRSYAGHPELNNYLSRYKERIQKIIRLAKIEDPFMPFEEIKKIILKEVKNKSEHDFFQILDLYINTKKPHFAHTTNLKYINLKKQLKLFSNETNYLIILDKIDLAFFEQLHNFYFSLEHSNNTIKDKMKLLKSFLRWAHEREYTKNNKFEKYKGVKYIQVDAIALTKDDLTKIITCSISNEKLEKVKDVFLFQLYTGQRFSDIANFKYSDVKGNTWMLRQAKTKKVMEIPLIEPALDILSKYDNILPVISNQKTNKYLKELGEKAGLNDIITVTKFIGAEKIEKQVPKYELLTTHTARRTFVSMASYEGVNQQVVKSYTGHGTDAMLGQYFKKNTEESRKAIENIFTN